MPITFFSKAWSNPLITDITTIRAITPIVIPITDIKLSRDIKELFFGFK